MNRARGIACIALLLLFAALMAGGVASPQSATVASPVQRMDRYMREQTAAREFSGSVIVAKNGRILFSRGYGYADRKSGRKNSPKTLFRLAGFPTFNTLAVYQLRDRGRLQLDDTVCRFVPKCPQRWDPITVSSLLDGESGLPDLWRLRAGRRLLPTIEQAVVWMKNQQVLFPAGSGGKHHDESPAPQVLLAYVIERAAGMDWLNYVRSAILKPARMTSTFVGRDAPAARQAIGYLLPSFRVGRDVEFTRPDPVNGMWTTAADLFRLDQAIYRGVVLTARARAELFPEGVHTVDGLHGYDRPQGHVADGWFTIFGHHAPDHVFVALVMNGRKSMYRFYDIELRLASFATGGKARRSEPVQLPPGPLLAVSGDLGVITLASADGSARAALTTPYAGYGLPAAWSADGRRLLFNRCGGGRVCRAFAIDANGLHEHQVGTGYAMGWSPDGRAVVGVNGHLWLVNVKSGRRARPSSRALQRVVGTSFVFSPDGKSLLYTSVYGPRGHFRSWLLVLDLTTGVVRRLRNEAGFYRIGSQAWSPDGTTIAFSRKPSVGALGGGAYIVGSDGQGLRMIGSGAGGGPSWSPDGRQLAYNLGIGCKVRIIRVDGSGATMLPFEGCGPIWRPMD